MYTKRYLPWVTFLYTSTMPVLHSNLAFVPLPHSDTYIEALSADMTKELAVLLNWFEDNYIGRPNRLRTSRRPPLFSPEMWNLYERTLHKKDQKNNHAEAANRRLQTEPGTGHTTIWRFITELQKMQRNRVTFFEGR